MTHERRRERRVRTRTAWMREGATEGTVNERSGSDRSSGTERRVRKDEVAARARWKAVEAKGGDEWIESCRFGPDRRQSPRETPEVSAGVVGEPSGGEARAVTHSVERTSPMGGPFVGVCRLCGAVGLTSGDALKPCPNPSGLTQDEALLDALAGSADLAPQAGEREGGTLVDRLAARFIREVMKSPDLPHTLVQGDARFFLRAIADKIERDYFRAHGNTIAAHLRTEAER